ncbi:MAG: glutamate ligase domain-containing protein, partial [Myxococcaceae bacterium]
EVLHRGKTESEVLLPMGGAHNVENALGVYAAGWSNGLSHEELRHGFASFTGVKRRQEVRAEVNGVMVVDDFAHHPTAVRETIAAVKGRYPSRRLWAIFEPRSNTSRRNIHQHEYAESFGGSSRVFIKVPEKTDRVPTGEELDVPKLVEDIKHHGIESIGHSDVGAMVKQVAAEAKPGDLLLVMSNGSFGGFIDKLIAELKSKPGGA